MVGWILRVLFGFAKWALRLRIVYGGDDVDEVMPNVPLIVACRPAGPGDSFILVNSLINDFRRNPRIVLKDTLQWDPMIDVTMNRLPTVFLTPTPFDGRDVRSRGGGSIARIARMAQSMREHDALVVFPEGGNFSEARWQNRIRQLEDGGYGALADRAAEMRNLLAPRPGGLFGAVDAIPEAGLVFVGHTGVERFDNIRELWRELPTNKVLTMNSWFVPPGEIPTERDERVEWLFDWWEKIDRWVESRRSKDEA